MKIYDGVKFAETFSDSDKVTIFDLDAQEKRARSSNDLIASAKALVAHQRRIVEKFSLDADPRYEAMASDLLSIMEDGIAIMRQRT